jgi:hypothetical protein
MLLIPLVFHFVVEADEICDVGLIGLIFGVENALAMLPDFPLSI